MIFLACFLLIVATDSLDMLRLCGKVLLLMAAQSQNPGSKSEPGSLYCPACAKEVNDPLTCGDCSAVICRHCGTPLESSDELGIG